MEMMNSRNHRGKGQNVLFNDGHVAWCNNPSSASLATTSTPVPPNAAYRAHRSMPGNRYDSNLGPQLPLNNNLGGL